MELYAIFMTVLVVCLSVMLMLTLRQQSAERRMESETSRSFLSSTLTKLESTQVTMLAEQTRQLQTQANLVDKAMALVGTADPIAFQQVQAMGTPSAYDDPETFDPSEAAELNRIRERNPNLGEQGDGVNGIPNEILGELGIDPEQFWSAGYPNDPAV